MTSSLARLPSHRRDADASVIMTRITTAIIQIESEPHRHARAQLLLPLEGVLLCSSERGLWMVPPSTAIWIPSEFLQSLSALGEVRCLRFMIHNRLTTLMPDRCYTLSVSKPFGAFLVAAASSASTDEGSGLPPALCRALLAKVLKAPLEALHLPMPQNARLRAVVAAIMAEGPERTPRTVLADHAGISDTTLARGMLAETGLSLSAWRQQLIVMKALRLMVNGAPVQTIFADLGYETLGGFTKMFRRTFGRSPASFLDKMNSHSVHLKD